MLTKAWIAVLMGLVLGSLLFSSGCGWFGNGYSNNPYGGAPCNCGAAHPGSVPAGAIPTASGTGGWRSVPAAGDANSGGVPATTTP
ncbi:MAG: hypothetical protein ACR2FY_09330 [Pirellulaceae bacterium]